MSENSTQISQESLLDLSSKMRMSCWRQSVRNKITHKNNDIQTTKPLKQVTLNKDELEKIDKYLKHIFYLLNELLSIQTWRSETHPGAVMQISKRFNVGVSKGTGGGSFVKEEYKKLCVVVSPDKENGLNKPTLFHANLKFVAFQDVKSSKHIGRLSEMDFKRIKDVVCKNINMKKKQSKN